MKPIDATKYMRQLKYLPDITSWCGVLMVIIIFFLTMPFPLIDGDSRIILPEAKYAHYEPPLNDLTPTISIKNSGEVYLDYKEVRELKLLPTMLKETMEEMNSKSLKILFNVDVETLWGKVREVMEILKGTNIKFVGLVTERNVSVFDYWDQQKLYREKGLREPVSVK